MPNQLIVTGSGGLIGSKFVSNYKDKYQIIPFDISNKSNPVDITNADQVDKAIAATTAKYILHFAAFTDVTAAWEQTGDKSGLAYQVNVVGTENIARSCTKQDKHLIHISTSYIFDGTKLVPYIESDEPNPIEWYGETKALAEEKVQTTADKWTILRIDQPFRQDKYPKADLVHQISTQLKANNLPPQFTDHFFGPTIIEDFINVIDWVIRSNTTGVFHASSGESWTNFDFAQEIAEQLHLLDRVKPGSLASYLKSSNRPYQKNTALNCDKLHKQIDFQPQTVKAALAGVDYDTPKKQ